MKVIVAHDSICQKCLWGECVKYNRKKLVYFQSSGQLLVHQEKWHFCCRENWANVSGCISNASGGTSKQLSATIKTSKTNVLPRKKKLTRKIRNTDNIWFDLIERELRNPRSRSFITFCSWNTDKCILSCITCQLLQCDHVTTSLPVTRWLNGSFSKEPYWIAIKRSSEDNQTGPPTDQREGNMKLATCLTFSSYRKEQWVICAPPF